MLRQNDAEYLRDRVQARHPQSLLAILAGRAAVEDISADWPWDLANLPEVPPVLRDDLRDAKHFAVCMQGAALLYNLMLSELKERDEWKEKYRRNLAKWADEVHEIESALTDWGLDRVWRVVENQGRSLRHPTREFVRQWVKSLSQSGPNGIADDDNARSLVRDREAQLKRARARLANPRRLELWGGESGTRRMTYRWGPSKRILKDIFDGLARSQGSAGDA